MEIVLFRIMNFSLIFFEKVCRLFAMFFLSWAEIYGVVPF